MNTQYLKITLTFALLLTMPRIVWGQEPKDQEEPVIISVPDLQDNSAQSQSTISEEQKRLEMDQIYLEQARVSSPSSSVDGTDVGTPANSAFQLGNDISGTIQNTVNEITGKLAFSVPIGNLRSGEVKYTMNLGYDGLSGFKTGTELNKYRPTSTVGVGWSLPVPKIVVNNKQTASRDDDEFYLIDGATYSKMICVDKVNFAEWTFQLEKYANWKITYRPTIDTWTVIKDDGLLYNFGAGTARDVVSTWGNWIGESNQSPTGSQVSAWYIARITDQWNNYIDFAYESVLGRQNTSQNSYKHTEALYLKEVVSSQGGKIKLVYYNKDIAEYDEPHREKSEPDAYQERYEKKYLKRAEIYNPSNEIVTTYYLDHTLQTIANANKKRYLTAVRQLSHKNGQSFTLPSQQFEYHTSGTYKGGLKKITYPSGGVVTYNYQNKYLFYNGANKFVTTPNWPSGYNFYSAVVRDNYSIFVLRTATPVTGNKHRFKFFRYWWNGQKWESHEFTFPHLIADNYPNSGDRLTNFSSVIGNDFYGFAYNKGSQSDMYLFHKEKDGNSWHYYTHTSLNTANGTPTFMSGNDFVALGSHHAGRIYTYLWNGSSWQFKQFNQGPGQYYYAANNNFILSLDEDGGTDMVTGVSHEDNYYMHYLDAEKKWQTKSWSAAADPYIHGIEKPSYFFPSNSIAGFVADDNPELFLRWSKDYNLIAVDNVLGGYHDAHTLQPAGNSMFTLVWYWANEAKKSARFNGVNWSVSDFTSSVDHTQVNFGRDFMTYKNETSDYIMYKEYSPNYHSWVSNNLNWCPWYTSFQVNGINTEFFVARNKIFKRTLQGPPAFPTLQIGTLQYDNDFTYSDGLGHAYIKEVEYTNNGSSASSEFKKGSYFYIDKTTGQLANINMGLKYYLRGSKKFGGNTPFMSPRAMWVRQDNTPTNFNPYLYRIINDKFNQSVYDIVVSQIELNDMNGNIRKINYTYADPNSTDTNEVTYYGEVTVRNVGAGLGNIGMVKKKFNNGSDDVQMLGLVKEEHVLDANNVLQKKTTNTWQKYLKTAHNGSYITDLSYYLGLKSKKDELFFGANSSEKVTSYVYNSKGQVVNISTTNSRGQVERQDIRYAHEQYTFVRDENKMTETYETTTRLDGAIVDVKRNVWINSGGHVYNHQNWSGPSTSDLRLNSEITKVDTEGNVLETSDGKNIYNAILNGYDNLYEVASVANATHQDLLDELDVTYSQLQNLNTAALKVELMKLYDRLPNAMITLSFYDANGRLINKVNERQEESYIYYDNHGRIDYLTDGNGNVIEKKEYNFGN